MAPKAHTADISDSTLRRLMAGAVTAMFVWFALRPWLSPVWREPGSPELYLTGVAGALLLLMPVAFALAKRGGRSRAPLAWFNAHVICSSLGAVLIVIHSGGFLRRPPALLLLAIAALALLGVWARLRGSRRMAATFASKQSSFALPDAHKRERLRQLIAQKRGLLGELDPAASEATFSVTLAHLLRRPRLGLAYAGLARVEAKLLGTRQAVGPAQSWWRPLHMAVAWIFVLGVLVHVVTVTFFAGYVAAGQPITWWHLAAW